MNGNKSIIAVFDILSGPSTNIWQPGPGQGIDVWTTSVYCWCPGGGGPGGGLDDEDLRVGGWGDLYYSLMQFDNAGLPQHADSAILYLYNHSANSGSPVSMYLDRIAETWTWQDRLWWANRPSADQWLPNALPAPAVNAWYSVDITSLFNAWKDGSLPNCGIQFRPTANNNNFNIFFSSDYSIDPSLRPNLVVTSAADYRPLIALPSVLNGSQVSLLLTVADGKHYRIQASTDLTIWTDQTNFVGSVSPVVFHDSASGSTRRFYRIVSP